MNDPIFETKILETKDDYTKLEITPLEKGYGHTLGNALRRVLLGSLPGAAITSVKITGVKHQFSTLKGMKEDVVELLLNLKRVSVKYDGDKPAKATISVEGPAEVKAKDIQTDSSVKIANPELVLAVLNKGTKLSAKLEIESGFGYSLAEERKTGEIGLIPLDASFSPIKRVNYKVEETRVGRLTNFDKLIIEVWTDNTIEVLDALKLSAQTLVKYLNQIITPKKVEEKEEEPQDELGMDGKLSVEEIGLPTRVANALHKAGYETVKDLSRAKKNELVKVRNLGEKSIKIINAALGEREIDVVIK